MALVNVADTPPCTPRSTTRGFTPPPAPKKQKKPPLMRALLSGSSCVVQKVLEEDPSTAQSVFFDYMLEPPLCCAARAGCDPATVGLLLAHKARTNACDVRGRNALACLAATQPSKALSDLTQHCMPRGFDQLSCQKIILPSLKIEVNRRLEVAAILLAAGVDPELTDHNGVTPAQFAHATKQATLAHLLEHYHGVQACVVFSRMPDEQFPMSWGMLETICLYLVPACTWNQLLKQSNFRKLMCENFLDVN